MQSMLSACQCRGHHGAGGPGCVLVVSSVSSSLGWCVCSVRGLQGTPGALDGQQGGQVHSGRKVFVLCQGRMEGGLDLVFGVV